MSNESIGIERGGARYVMRRPAKIALEGADRGMRREFRLLMALEGTPVPHPKPVALCEDPSVAGCVAYLMEHVDGFAPAFGLPAPFAGNAELQRDIALAAMSALGELARVDWRARGLGDFGRPEGFHARQVRALAPPARALRRHPGAISRDCARSAPGSKCTGPPTTSGRRRSCTATITSPICSSRPSRPPASPRSSTGRTRRSAIRCSTSRRSCAYR
jgi:hypothetical protein